METAAEIAKHFIPCTCDEMYTSRRMIAPDCPLHAFDVVSSMEAFSREVSIDFIRWVGKKTYKDWNLPEDIWCGVSDGKVIYLNSEQLFELYLKDKSNLEKPNE